MGKIHIGLNAEFSRSSDKPFEWAVKAAADMGFHYFEPMIHFGRELMSEAGYFHTVSMFDDPYLIKEACDAAGLTISGQAGSTYVLKYTIDVGNTNFDTWTPLATNTMGSSPWYYADWGSCGSPKRSYGARLVP